VRQTSAAFQDPTESGFAQARMRLAPRKITPGQKQLCNHSQDYPNQSLKPNDKPAERTFGDLVCRRGSGSPGRAVRQTWQVGYV